MTVGIPLTFTRDQQMVVFFFFDVFEQFTETDPLSHITVDSFHACARSVVISSRSISQCSPVWCRSRPSVFMFWMALRTDGRDETHGDEQSSAGHQPPVASPCSISPFQKK